MGTTGQKSADINELKESIDLLKHTDMPVIQDLVLKIQKM